jgi:hypothetical protein
MARSLVPSILLALLLGLGAAPVGAEIRDNSELNYSLETPPGWTWDDKKAAWEKDKVVDAARRVLDKIEGGKPAQGQGAQAHLSVMDPPAGATLETLAADAAQREFVLRLFAGASAPPTVEVEDTIVKGANGTVPAKRLVVKGPTLNLQGAEGPARALLLLALAKGKLYRLRLVAYMTEHDDAGLSYDLDAIDNNFQIPDVAEVKPKGEPGKPPPDGHEPGKPPGEPGHPPEEPHAEDVGDENEETVVELKEVFLKYVKPKKLRSKAIDKKAQPNAVIFIESNDRDGSCQVLLNAYENGRVVDGVQQGNQDIQKWNTTSWYQWLTAALPAGELVTYAWPKNRNTATFLTLPLWDKQIMVAETPKKRPADPNAGEIIKKLKMVEEAEGKLGDVKPIQAFRGVIKGNRERVGHERTLRFSWSTNKWTYMLSVVFGREGLVKYGEPVQKLLGSIELMSDRR